MPQPERRLTLNVALTRAEMRQLLHTGQQHDIEEGGLYDARSGCVNLWCIPEDKPACWDVEILAGGLSFARSYVGALEWEWDADDTAHAYIEVTPYDLLDARERDGLSAVQWEQLLSWTEEKTRDLLALARSAPQLVGTHCPFCAFVLPTGALLNTLVTHIAQAHPQEKPTGLVIGKQSELITRNDKYPLLPAELNP